MLYLQIIDLLKQHGVVLTEHLGGGTLSIDGEVHLSDAEIYERDCEWIRKTDIIIAEVTTTSLGVGYEIGYAEAFEKPIICLYRPTEGKRLSAMLNGNVRVKVVEYQTIEELKPVFESVFKNLGNLGVSQYDTTMQLKWKKLNPEAKLASYAKPGDVGIDLYSLEEKTLNPGDHHRFYVGVAFEFPVGHAAIIKDKSSISSKGLHTMGGVFDAGYRGEYNVHLVNLSSEPYTVEKGDKIAQVIFYPVALAEMEEVEELSESERGHGAFGSTGRK